MHILNIISYVASFIVALYFLALPFAFDHLRKVVPAQLSKTITSFKWVFSPPLTCAGVYRLTSLFNSLIHPIPGIQTILLIINLVMALVVILTLGVFVTETFTN